MHMCIQSRATYLLCRRIVDLHAGRRRLSWVCVSSSVSSAGQVPRHFRHYYLRVYDPFLSLLQKRVSKLKLHLKKHTRRRKTRQAALHKITVHRQKLSQRHLVVRMVFLAAEHIQYVGTLSLGGRLSILPGLRILEFYQQIFTRNRFSTCLRFG